MDVWLAHHISRKIVRVDPRNNFSIANSTGQIFLQRYHWSLPTSQYGRGSYMHDLKRIVMNPIGPHCLGRHARRLAVVFVGQPRPPLDEIN